MLSWPKLRALLVLHQDYRSDRLRGWRSVDEVAFFLPNEARAHNVAACRHRARAEKTRKGSDLTMIRKGT
jgi:hypothetical protein